MTLDCALMGLIYINKAFDRLKALLLSAPVLPLPNKNKYYIDTDASDRAIEAELIQVQNGKERVIAYGSFILTPDTVQHERSCWPLYALLDSLSIICLVESSQSRLTTVVSRGYWDLKNPMDNWYAGWGSLANMIW